MKHHREVSKKDLQEIKNNFKILTSHGPIQIIAIAVSKNYDDNHESVINCVSGAPINFKSVYNITTDSYHIHCASYLDLGMIELAYAINFPGSEAPAVFIPIPDSIVKKWFLESGNDSHSSWLIEHPEDKYDIKYLQILCSY